TADFHVAAGAVWIRARLPGLLQADRVHPVQIIARAGGSVRGENLRCEERSADIAGTLIEPELPEESLGACLVHDDRGQSRCDFPQFDANELGFSRRKIHRKLDRGISDSARYAPDSSRRLDDTRELSYQIRL